MVTVTFLEGSGANGDSHLFRHLFAPFSTFFALKPAQTVTVTFLEGSGANGDSHLFVTFSPFFLFFHLFCPQTGANGDSHLFSPFFPFFAPKPEQMVTVTFLRGAEQMVTVTFSSPFHLFCPFFHLFNGSGVNGDSHRFGGERRKR